MDQHCLLSSYSRPVHNIRPDFDSEKLTVVKIPSHVTDMLQPLDDSCFGRPNTYGKSCLPKTTTCDRKSVVGTFF